MNRFLLDLQFNLRLLRKTPLFTVISLLVITIGMTVSITIYNMLYEIMLRPPEFADGDRYVSVRTAYIDPRKQGMNPLLSMYSFNVVKEKAKSFDFVGAMEFNEEVLQGTDVTVPVKSIAVTPELSAAIHKPFLGRTFNREDAEPGAPPSILLSTSIWKQYFNGDTNIIGNTANLNGSAYTVIGIVPDETHYLGVSDVYKPLYIPPNAAPDDNVSYQLVGRLRAGVSKNEAELELNAIISQICREHPDSHSPMQAQIRPFQSFIVNQTAPNSGVDQGAIAIQWVALAIFLLVSVNLGSLLFLRASGRQQELALRNAMGSSLWGISRQVLTESFILCAIGAVVGLILSAVISQNFAGLYQQMLSNISLSHSPFRFGLTNHMLASAGVFLLSLWLLSNAMSIFHLFRSNLLGSLNEGYKGTTSRKRTVVTNTVVGVEVVLCFFLLIVCGLLSISVYRVFNTDMGASFANRYSGYVDFPRADYPDPQQRIQLVDSLNQLLMENPMVEAVCASYSLPGLTGLWMPFALADRDIKRDGLNPIIMQNSVAGNYHELMDIPLLEGRYFDSSDTRDAQAVAIVSQPFAERYWPNESAIGKRFKIHPEGPSIGGVNAYAEPEWLTIVGVTKHVIHNIPIGRTKNSLSFYRPNTQYTSFRFRTIVQTRKQESLIAVEQLLQSRLSSIDRNLAFRQVDTLENLSHSYYFHLFLLGKCSAGMGLGAIILSFIAIFGVVSRSVALRTTEIGIRRALGSTKQQALNLFLKQGLVYLSLGLVIGGTASIAAGNLMTIVFPSIIGLMPVVGITVVATIGIIILLASWLPAKQAVAMEPGDALRDE